MKKLFSLILGTTVFLGLLGFSFACEDVNLNDGDICVDIEQNGNDYTLDTSVTCDVSSCSLYCDILLPDNTLENVGACNGTFEWDGNDEEKVKIYVSMNNDYDTIEEYYDFDDGERGNSSSNGDLDSFDFYYVEDDSPDKDEWVTVRVEALDNDDDRISDYDETVTLKFERDGDDADDYDLKIQSDDFNEDEDDLDSNGEIEVEFDNGYLEFEVWFEYEDEFTITVEDEGENVDEYENFDVGGSSSSNGDLDSLVFYYIEDDSPDKDEWITIRIEALDNDDDTISDYDDTVVLKFERDGDDADDYDLKIQSDDFNEDEDDLDSNGEIEVEFNNGDLEFEVWFEYEDEYTITVEDEGENIDDYYTFDVNGSSSSNGDIDNFDFYYVEDDSPDKDKRITIRIKALDNDDDVITNYDDEVTLTFERDNDPADDNDLKIQSNDFNEDEDDLGYHGEIKVNFDNGYLEFEVRFEYEDDYTIFVEDGSPDDKHDFDVGGSSSLNGDLDGFDFYYVEDKSPGKDEWITVKIEALNDGDDRIYDYDDTVVLRFERDGDDADDYDIKIQSDDFNEDEDDLDSNGEIEVDFDNGYLEFEVWFEHEDEYTITVEDEGENVDEDQDFDIGDAGSDDSDIDGFTNDELETVDRIYKIRPKLIQQLKDENSDLDSDNERDDMSDNLYDDMKDVLDDDYNRAFDDYDEFFDAFEEWYSYTLDVIH